MTLRHVADKTKHFFHSSPLHVMYVKVLSRLEVLYKAYFKHYVRTPPFGGVKYISLFQKTFI